MRTLLFIIYRHGNLEEVRSLDQTLPINRLDRLDARRVYCAVLRDALTYGEGVRVKVERGPFEAWAARELRGYLNPPRY